MKTFNRFIIAQLVSFFILILTGCAAKYVMLDRAVVRNDTGGIITDVKVVHEPTGKTGGVNMILPQMSFELGFAGQPMLAKRAIITWKDHKDIRRRSEVVLPDRPDASKQGQSHSLVYTIKPTGGVVVHLENSDI